MLENVTGFRDALNAKRLISDCGIFPGKKTRLGIAFVAMKRNIADLPAVLDLAHNMKAKHLLVTNVLPYTNRIPKR